MKAADIPAKLAETQAAGQRLLLDHYTDGAHLPTTATVREATAGPYDRYGDLHDGDDTGATRVLVQLENWYGDPVVFDADDDVEVYVATPA